MAFGGQFVRVVERAPEMISMVAQQLAETEPGVDSVLSRARVALHELDNAADRLVAGKPLRPSRRTIPVPPKSVAQTPQAHRHAKRALLAAAVFIGLVFWGALWGVWGLFLGPALVVLIKVLAEHSRHGDRFAKLMQG